MTALASFQRPMKAAVVGASGGIGGALVKRLADDPAVGDVLALSRSGSAPDAANIRTKRIDITDEASVAAVFAEETDLDLVLVATGVLQGDGFSPEKTWRHIDADAFAEVFAINTTGPALVAKHALPKLASRRKAAFAALSARVGSISDNGYGGWHAYRASKAALNMLIRNFAIELARKNETALCVGLHPGTVDTELSRPFQRNVPDEKLFTPDYSAERLIAVLESLTPERSGKCFAWDGIEIPA
ncbi:MAG: SDR family NAD(P)-dependent oxidoreductase [Pseudomonadota bacterium]